MRLLHCPRFAVVLVDVLLAGGGSIADIERDLRHGEVSVSGIVVTDPYATVGAGSTVLVRDVLISRHPYWPRGYDAPASR